MPPLAWLSLLIFVVTTVVGAFVYARDPKNLLHRVYVFGMVACDINILNTFGYRLFTDYKEVLAWSVHDIFWTWNPAIGVYLAVLITGRRDLLKKWWIHTMGFAFPFLILVADVLSIVLNGRPFSMGVPELTHLGWAYGIASNLTVFVLFDIPFVLLYVFCTVFTYQEWSKAKMAKDEKKRGQIRILLFSFISNLILTALNMSPATRPYFAPTGDIGILIWVSLISYAIWKYEMLPIDELKMQLLQAQKMEAIGRLGAGIAHDINNMLATIVMSASELALTAVPGSREAESSNLILDACKRGKDLAYGILSYSRQRKYQKTVFDGKDLIYKIETLLRRTIPKNTTLNINAFSTVVYPVKGDITQLTQVLINVCLNAVDAVSSRDEGRIDISLGQERSCFKIRVRDNGVGMPDKVKDQVFDPFFTTKPRTKGTGLGLSMAWGTVADHGGTIDIESEVGSGTLVTISLPVSREPVVQPASAPPRAISEVSSRDHWVGRRVLVVDDEPLILDSSRRFFGNLKFEVTTALSGKEALYLYKKEEGNFDIIILDHVMPGLTGLETLEALRDLDSNVGSKILLCSGYVGKVDVPNTVRFVGKPYTLGEIETHLEDILGKRVEV